MKFSDLDVLTNNIKTWGKALGFQQIGITDTELSQYQAHFIAWLQAGYQGEMNYLEKNAAKRLSPDQLVPGTLRIISARMDYLPPSANAWQVLQDANKGYVSRYALGRDYHRLIRKRLEKLAQRIDREVKQQGYRAFCDSAPILEKPIAQKAGLGWIGKHTNLINPKAGSWFFLGEIFTDVPLTIDTPFAKNHCGSCQACLDICPTGAIIGPQKLDARLCISYLTIELKGSIPIELRPLLGNRIYGCDDCQLICPWNKFAKHTEEKDFHPRHRLDASELLDLFAWTETEFLHQTEGSAIRRIGYECWQRNIAVALGNAPPATRIIQALHDRRKYVADLVKEHIDWALSRQLQALDAHDRN